MGTYKQLTNLDYDDDSDEECIPELEEYSPHKPVSIFARPGTFGNKRPSLTVNLPNVVTLEEVDDVPSLEDSEHFVELETHRTVVYSGSDSIDGE